MSTTKRIATTLLNLPPVDHRSIGLRQKLFFFDSLSQGSCFFLPRGAHIYNKLIDFIRRQYIKRGYDEVITPNIYDCDLWKQSGHWQHYQDNMIKFQISEKEFSLKPMNCPGHCLMYQRLGKVKANQLPIRWADFGVLHRNENSGSLTGLSRVRRFQQDDAHIFCSPQQVAKEVELCIDFAKEVYSLFNFKFDLKLSLRPTKFMGNPFTWDMAENSLRSALNRSQLEWTEQPFEGAFYGPKIDLAVWDQHKRSQQCATIQLDFQLPHSFDLVYGECNENEDNDDDQRSNTTLRPVIIHRAILGSIERFIAMIAETCEGRWPFWLSPLQAQVIPITSNVNSYAQSVCDQLREAGFEADCDLRIGPTLNAKLRESLTMPYNVTLLVGDQEKRANQVTCRVSKQDDSSASKEQPKRVHNIKITVSQLLELFREFEQDMVDRADHELLRRTHSPTELSAR